MWNTSVWNTSVVLTTYFCRLDNFINNCLCQSVHHDKWYGSSFLTINVELPLSSQDPGTNPTPCRECRGQRISSGNSAENISFPHYSWYWTIFLFWLMPIKALPVWQGGCTRIIQFLTKIERIGWNIALYTERLVRIWSNWSPSMIVKVNWNCWP